MRPTTIRTSRSRPLHRLPDATDRYIIAFISDPSIDQDTLGPPLLSWTFIIATQLWPALFCNFSQWSFVYVATQWPPPAYTLKHYAILAFSNLFFCNTHVHYLDLHPVLGGFHYFCIPLADLKFTFKVAILQKRKIAIVLIHSYFIITLIFALSSDLMIYWPSQIDSSIFPFLSLPLHATRGVNGVLAVW